MGIAALNPSYRVQAIGCGCGVGWVEQSETHHSDEIPVILKLL
jgi:hypothetical protein